MALITVKERVLKIFSSLILLLGGQIAAAMSGVTMGPPADMPCKGSKKLSSVMELVRSTDSIVNLADQTLLELLIGISCESLAPNPDQRMMALANAIFIGSTHKKAVLFCGDTVRKRDEVFAVSGFAYRVLDESRSGEMVEDSTDNLAHYNVKVQNGDLTAMSFNGVNAVHLTPTSGDLWGFYGFKRYDLSCEVYR